MTTVLTLAKASVKQTDASLIIQVPCPRTNYVDAILRRDCFEELRSLFALSHAPAKELSESYAALHHLRRSLTVDNNFTVLHVGDGAHCRTGALFAFLTKTFNRCIDPAINEKVMRDWMARYDVQRLTWAKMRVEDYPLERVTEPCLVTFVHAHVNTAAVLARIPQWRAAYINICCHPQEQAMPGECVAEGQDWAILSPERRYQVLLNRKHLQATNIS